MKLEFGSWLKRRRRLLDLTQEDLAQRAHCSVNTVRKIESGDLTPSRQLALSMARALDLDPAHDQAFVQLVRTPGATAREDAFSNPPNVELPPAAPLPPARFRAPFPLTSAIGREHDTSVIMRVLRLPTGRLVTLTGPPGTGKTRLALEVANALDAEFEHGVAFVALAPLTHAEFVESTIAEQLDVREAADMPLSTALRAFLRDKQLLLVLDNFEHLPDAAPLVPDLLRAAPKLKVLVTSREPLRVYGEREIPVSPLELPPLSPLPPWGELERFSATQLFVERAQQVKPDFELNAANAETIAQLTVGLDGLPLAIEMAAARVKWDSPQALLGQWKRRLSLLKSSTRDSDPRQRTLRGAIDWSYDRLQTPEQQALRELGVFRGSFSLEAAQAVLDDAPADVLERLVEKSLVKYETGTEEGTRYALLEMIREYALERLEAEGDAGGTRERHARYFRAQASKLGTRHWTDLAALGEFSVRDTDNYRAAIEWYTVNHPTEGLGLVIDICDFWTDSYLVREARDRLAELVPLCQDSAIYARGLNTAAGLALMQGDHEECVALAGQARRVAEERGQRDELGLSLQMIGRVAIYHAEYARAEELLLAAREHFAAMGMGEYEAYVLNNLGIIAKDRGDLALAGTYHEEALAMRRRLELKDWIPQSLLNLSIVAYWEGNYERAIELGNEALAGYRAKGDGLGDSYVLENIGMSQFKLGRYDEARETLRNGLVYVRRIGDKRGMALLLNALGEVERAQGDLEQAKSSYRETLELCLQTGEKRRAVLCMESYAGCLADLGKMQRAAQMLGAADAMRREIGVTVYAAERADYDKLLERVRADLGRDEFEPAWIEGGELGFEAAVQLAGE